MWTWLMNKFKRGDSAKFGPTFPNPAEEQSRNPVIGNECLKRRIEISAVRSPLSTDCFGNEKILIENCFVVLPWTVCFGWKMPTRRVLWQTEQQENVNSKCSNLWSFWWYLFFLFVTSREKKNTECGCTLPWVIHLALQTQRSDLFVEALNGTFPWKENLKSPELITVEPQSSKSIKRLTKSALCVGVTSDRPPQTSCDKSQQMTSLLTGPGCQARQDHQIWPQGEMWRHPPWWPMVMSPQTEGCLFTLTSPARYTSKGRD